MFAIKARSAIYRNNVLILLFLDCLLFLAGCRGVTTSVHVYDGEALAGDKIAKVTVEQREQTFSDKIFSFYPSRIFIMAVDDKNLEDFGQGKTVVAKEVFVLPGPHTFGIKFSGPGGTPAGVIPALLVYAAKEYKYGPFGTALRFNTDAGRKYEIHFNEKTEAWKGIVDVKYWVEDVNSGQIILGVKPPASSPK